MGKACQKKKIRILKKKMGAVKRHYRKDLKPLKKDLKNLQKTVKGVKSGNQKQLQRLSKQLPYQYQVQMVERKKENNQISEGDNCLTAFINYFKNEQKKVENRVNKIVKVANEAAKQEYCKVFKRQLPRYKQFLRKNVGDEFDYYQKKTQNMLLNVHHKLLQKLNEENEEEEEEEDEEKEEWE